MPLILLVILIVASGYSTSTLTSNKKEIVTAQENKQNQTINVFVTHGHCNTPFSGIVDNLIVDVPKRTDLGNPLENMKIVFEVDPNSFNVCARDADDLTARIKTPGLFISETNDKITFHSTEVYTIGLDWYQLNGILSIKGVENDVKLMVTGIRDPKEAMANIIVLEGQINLLDWGIDYDKIVYGKSETVPTKWMYINMKINMS